MRVRWRRRLLVTVGLGALFCSGVVVALAAPTPPTLSGETLNGSGTGFSLCPSPTFTISGTAGNPYSGSFSETGNWTSTSFSATFTIVSGTTTITGSKSGGSGSCDADPQNSGTIPESARQSGPYTATIHTPSGDFVDAGFSAGSVTAGAFTGTLNETFTSTLPQPVPFAPTSFAQCMSGGWQNFPQFKNQGGCISFVATGGKNSGGG
jgi:hypothetical protein